MNSPIHQSYLDNCQRLFNAIEPGSYIRPHRHSADSRDELLIAIQGSMILVTFDDSGSITKTLRFGSSKHKSNLAKGVEVSSTTWHTVIALESDSILLEVKAGPFNPNQPKDFPSWAPEEGSNVATDYLNRMIKGFLNE